MDAVSRALLQTACCTDALAGISLIMRDTVCVLLIIHGTLCALLGSSGAAAAALLTALLVSPDAVLPRDAMLLLVEGSVGG